MLSAQRLASRLQVDKGRWRNRTPTVACTLVFKTSCRPFSGIFHSGCLTGLEPANYLFHKQAPQPLWLQTPSVESRRIELLTSCLQGRRSSQLSYDPIKLIALTKIEGCNTLPLKLRTIKRMTRIELVPRVWKTHMLPLHHIRIVEKL